MSKGKEVRTRDGSIYYTKDTGSGTSVSKPGWFGRESVGSASNSRDAHRIIESDSGSRISKIK